jgi:hypothetical protein
MYGFWIRFPLLTRSLSLFYNAKAELQPFTVKPWLNLHQILRVIFHLIKIWRIIFKENMLAKVDHFCEHLALTLRAC